MTTETEAPADATDGAAETGDGDFDEPLAIDAGPDPVKEAWWTRAILPLALPLLSAVAVAVWVTNISRVFLAGGKQGALVVVLVVTVSIMAGAAFMSASERLRTSTKILLVAGFVGVIISAGLISLGPSEESEASGGGFVEPKGKAINTLEVDALPELSFQAKSFTVPAGVNQIKYVDKGGSHTLVFDKNAQPGFQLAVPVGKNALKVELKQGVTYTIYCTVPGHRQAGMQADIKVGPATGKPEAGTQSPTETTVPAGTTPKSIPGGENPTGTSPAQQSNSGE
jgi:plastocyanin